MSRKFAIKLTPSPLSNTLRENGRYGHIFHVSQLDYLEFMEDRLYPKEFEDFLSIYSALKDQSKNV